MLIAKTTTKGSSIYVKTSFGKTHLVETGNKAGKPLLVFHGGNATTAYNLLMCQFLLNNFHIYAVNTNGHPGKSDEVCLSHKGYAYGQWVSEVIDKLGYDSISCLGGSFGGGILAKLMCTAPQKTSGNPLDTANCHTEHYNLFQILNPTCLNRRNIFLNPVFRPVPPLQLK